ncbi:snRNA-activating protein complex subunit 1 [Armadillidium nasatum]|uniref:snRNA-activating protein complex subunit 1 n=1 Tax=Armadillidium nasatum TaxID=96803 RepID=A0A5N5SLJ3_9CRUS|nr:snRNA-activating protein complex subunit 1 [Armadillidium nasatum]
MDTNVLRKRSSRQMGKSNSNSKLESGIEEKTQRKNNLRVISNSSVTKEKDVEILSEEPFKSVTGLSQNVVSGDTTVNNKKVMVTLFKMNLGMFDPLKDQKISNNSSANTNNVKTSALTENPTLNSHQKPPEDETIDKIRNEVNSITNFPAKKRLNSSSSVSDSGIKKTPVKVPRFYSPKRKNSEPQNEHFDTITIDDDDDNDVQLCNEKKEMHIDASVKIGKNFNKIISKTTNNSKQLTPNSSKQNQSLIESQGIDSQSSSSTTVNLSHNNISPVVYLNSQPSPSKVETVNIEDHVKQTSDGVTQEKLSTKEKEESKKKKSPKGKVVDKVQQTTSTVETIVSSKQTPKKMRKTPVKTPTKSKSPKFVDVNESSSDHETLANLIRKVHNKEEKGEPQRKRTLSGSKKTKTNIKERKLSQSPIKKAGSVAKVKNEDKHKEETTKKLLKKENQRNIISKKSLTSEKNIPKKDKPKQEQKGRAKQETKGKTSKNNRNKIKSKVGNENQAINYDSDTSVNDGNMPVIKDPATIPSPKHVPLDSSLATLLDDQQKQKQQQQKQPPTPPAPPQKKRGRKKLEDGQKPRKKRGRKRIKKEVVEEAVNLEKPWGTEDEEDDEEDEEIAGDVKKRKTRKRSQRRTGRRFSVTGNWYIASGYLNDIISLLEDFENIDGWRFRDFSKCWQKKNFSLVYRGRQTFKELLEFSEEIALLTKRFLNPPHSTKRRIGALYTLYGLYYKFPLGKLRFFHLRFEYGEYEDLLALIFPFRSNVDNPDPAYIFRKLELEGAILHCASAIEPCYDFHNEERDHVELEYGKERLAKSSAVINAVPKMQLQADLNLLQHYHSLKAKVAGQDVPEKALSMITPDFLVGISTNLNNLRHDTLQELGMSGESASILKSESLIEEAATNQLLEEPYIESEMEIHSVDQSVIDTVNKGSAGQRSQNALRNNKIVSNQEVKEFMRPPTTEDLCQPLLLGKSRKIEGKEIASTTAQDVGKSSKDKQPPELLWDFEGKLDLDVQEERGGDYSELTEVLLPQPLPPKKQRRRKRPVALKMEASLPPRRKSKTKNELPTIVKSLSPNENKENMLSGNNDLEELSKPDLPQHKSATRLLASELTNLKPNISGTIIKVRMKAEGVRKLVKLKIKINSDQFTAIQKNPLRFKNFKNKLKPLIKATQKGEHKNKDWSIEDIFLHEEENDKQASNADTNLNNKTNKNNDSPVSAKKTIPFKARYECLKYSDDEDENNDELGVEEDDDDEMFRCKWRTEEEKDNEYCPPEDEPDVDPLEYQDEGIDEDDDYDDYIPEPNYFWRKKRQSRSHYYGNYFEERGPRDSDQLLKARSENSIQMVPMQVGGKIKYFPMIQTQENSPSKNSKNSEREMEEAEKELGAEELLKDPNDGKAIFTWNDFSSDKSPPFKKRRTINSFSYIFSPKIPLKNESDSKPVLRKIRSSTVIKETQKINSNENENIKQENKIENESDDDDDDDELDIKTEKTVLEELAGDWDDEEPLLNKQSRNSEKVTSDYPLDVENGDGIFEDFENNVKEVYVEDAQIYPIDDADIVDAGVGFQDDSEQGDFEENQEGIFGDNAQVSSSELSNSFIEESSRRVSQILPDIAITNDFGNDLFLNNEGNRDQNILPGNIIMTDCSAGTSLGQQSQVPIFTDAQHSTAFSSGFNLVPDSTEKQSPLYYRMTAADGNNIFVPISSFPTVPTAKDIRILSFDVADVKPLIDSCNVSSESYANGSFNDHQEQISDANFISHSSFSISNENPMYLNNKDNRGELVSYEQSSSLPLVNTEINPVCPVSQESTRSCSFLFSGKKPLPISKARPSVDNVKLNDSAKPSCSFLFSKKLEKTFKNFPSAKGEAKGKICPPEKPKVKFIMKGMFKFSKKC